MRVRIAGDRGFLTIKGLTTGGRDGLSSSTQIARGPRGPLQQVTWIKPILCALDCLNVRMASGVGCKMTLQCFFSK